MSCKLLTLAGALLLPLSVQAADIPKEGAVNFTFAWVVVSSTNIQQGTPSFDTYDLVGVTRNDAGGPMFDFFGARCVGADEVSGPGKSTTRGTCTWTDTDGDNIFTPYSGTAQHGTLELAGGTGKFAGITGNGEWSRLNPAPIKSDDKRPRAVNSLKVNWKLP